MFAVVTSSDNQLMDYLIYPQQHQSNHQFFQSQYQDLSPTLLDSGRRFMEASRQTFEQLNSEETRRKAHEALKAIDGFLGDSNQIVELTSLTALQCAAPRMQQYIMAVPYIRDKYQQQLCAGYGSSYLDPQPGVKAEDTFAYRDAMSGYVEEFTNPDGTDTWKAVTYFEEPPPEVVPLQPFERSDVQRTMELAAILALDGVDPTDPYGGNIG